MEVSREHLDGIMVLKLGGRFDAYAAPTVEQVFQTIPTAPFPYIVVDLSDVDFIDSTGLATLVIGMKRCRQHNGELILCGMCAPVGTIFELTRLDRVFITSRTQQEAIATIHHQSS